MSILFSPPLAFLFYLALALGIVWLGRQLAGPAKSNPVKSSLYGSGEEAATTAASPGYRPFFLIAFFFAILHLGMLVLGTSQLTMQSIIYLLGLVLALGALILG